MNTKVFFVFKETHTQQCEEDSMQVMSQWLLYLSTVNWSPEVPEAHYIPTSSYAIGYSNKASHDQSPFSVNALDTELELQLNSELQQYS